MSVQRIGAIITLLIVLGFSSCLNRGKIDSTPPRESPFAAWVDDGRQKWDVKANVSVADGVGVVLQDRPVPIDLPVEMEILYVAFKSEDLPGYNIFTITPGTLSPVSPKVIEVDYVGLRKDANKTFLDIVYRTNKPFDFDIGLSYSQDSLFANIYTIFSPVYETRLTISARENKNWQTASFEIKPVIKDEFKKLDLAISYLGKLDQNWRIGDQKFIWDERKISKDSASQIAKSVKSDFGEPKIRLLAYGDVLVEMSYSSPVLQQGIAVITKNDTRKEGTIAITF